MILLVTKSVFLIIFFFFKKILNYICIKLLALFGCCQWKEDMAWEGKRKWRKTRREEPTWWQQVRCVSQLLLVPRCEHHTLVSLLGESYFRLKTKSMNVTQGDGRLTSHSLLMWDGFALLGGVLCNLNSSDKVPCSYLVHPTWGSCHLPVTGQCSPTQPRHMSWPQGHWGMLPAIPWVLLS